MTAPVRYLSVPTRSFWKSLRYLCDARFIVALLLLAYVPLLGREAALEQSFDRRLFLALASAYVAFALACSVAVRVLQRGFHPQLLLQVLVDILVIGLIVEAAGGARSGLGVLMITPTAGAAILSTPLLSMFIAASASLILLAESASRALRVNSNPAASGGDLLIAGVISAALFFLVVVVNRLARRLSAQESLAARRGEDLSNQIAINELVIAELDQGVVVFDPSGQPRGMNPKARLFLELAPETSIERIDAQALAALRGLISSGQTESDLAFDSAGERRARYRVRVLTGGAQVDRVVLIEDLERIEDRARQLKLAAMGRMSASIAHEIRNPLGAIRHAGNLLGEQLTAPRHKRLATIIEENSLRIDRIVEDVLSIARRSAAREAVSLPAFFSAFLPEFIAQSDSSWERIRVALECGQVILFDSNHLRQVLVNLLSNALRYASESPAAILIRWHQPAGRRPVLRVLDDGPGVAPADRGNLFEPFHTTDVRGTGLGLHMAQELCSANNAVLRYESLEGVPDEPRYRCAFVIEPEPQRDGLRSPRPALMSDLARAADTAGSTATLHRQQDASWRQKQTV